ncbi:hypothetical protein FEM21_14410 [Flavobacterium seoulense]|uniref:Uncharacterized protein n=1 Tax=Flavobacterium seoulense TaxID=1492738 RepID=A0A066WWJ4_9FLAO|nr:hypothetical protein FEM21_14410 [Flavobacterium seoulense]
MKMIMPDKFDFPYDFIFIPFNSWMTFITNKNKFIFFIWPIIN